MNDSEHSDPTASKPSGGADTPGARRARRPGVVRIFPLSLVDVPVAWELGKTASIGRNRDVVVRLDDGQVSRKHAELGLVESGIRVRDLASRHGTFVNGQPTEPAGTLARFGSVIRVGDTLLLVVEDARPYAAPLRRIAGAFLGIQRDVIAGPVLWESWQQASRVAALPHPVLVQGESGSGKEAIARLLYAARETKGAFVALNVAAIPDGLFESELFGHVRGAFTGAVSARLGAFREALGGVLFLDEVADLALDLQVKLLRAIDQMAVRPLGSREDVPVETRLVAATSRDLRDACARGRFRLDLYYRLAGIVIEVPPLRKRRDDVIALALTMLEAEAAKLELSVEAAETLVLAAWEGNVRQLHHAITQAAVSALAANRRRIFREDLPELDAAEALEPSSRSRVQVEAAVRTASGNVSHAAKALGISRATLYNVFKRYGIDPAALRGESG